MLPTTIYSMSGKNPSILGSSYELADCLSEIKYVPKGCYNIQVLGHDFDFLKFGNLGWLQMGKQTCAKI